MGDNGAGKTTTMKMLATLYNPDKGTIEINGMNVCTKSGNVFDEPRLYEQLTGEENILYFALLASLSKSKYRMDIIFLIIAAVLGIIIGLIIKMFRN